MNEEAASLLTIHGPRDGRTALVLDSPHSGHQWPDDFGTILDRNALRDAEDAFIDQLWKPATALGVPLLAAEFPRAYLDPNRHAGDVDLDLLDGPWPHEHRPSGKARIGKSLIWRTLDDGRPLYDRRLSVAEVAGRIARCHAPYHAALRELMDTAHARHGQVVHLNCHSMNAVSGAMGEGGAGIARADIVLGDRDSSTCAPWLTAQVRDFLSGRGYGVKVNDPFKGVELVRAYSNPQADRHSLQIEVNKRLYLQPGRLQTHAGFERLQTDLMDLLRHLLGMLAAAPR